MKNYVEIDETVMASRGQRFANYIIDSIVYYLIIFFIGFLAGALFTYFDYDGMYLWIVGMGQWGQIAFNLTVMALYFMFMEGFTQRTVGKFITGTIVIMEDGSRPEAGVAALRTLCRFIPFEPFSFFGTPARGWHDTITKTYVIDRKKYNEALELKQSFDQIGAEEI